MKLLLTALKRDSIARWSKWVTSLQRLMYLNSRNIVLVL